MSKSRCSSSGFMRLKALKSKEVDETGVCTNQKAEPRPGPARTEGQSHPSRAGRASFPRQTRTSTDRGAEPSIPGRPGPAPLTKRQSLVTEWNVTPPGPVLGQCRWDGGLRRALLVEGQRSRLSRNQWSQTRGHMADQDQQRPGPARTEGQSPRSQEGRQSRLSRNQRSQTRGHNGRPGPA